MVPEAAAAVMAIVMTGQVYQTAWKNMRTQPEFPMILASIGRGFRITGMESDIGCSGCGAGNAI